MSEDNNTPHEEWDEEFSAPEGEQEGSGLESVVHVSGMYKEWFLDYASYVILERAVPHLYDGLKPVQRRILHSMKEMDDGRYHKVANVIGNTMKYHPHGDASIGDAMVQVGQKDLLIDCQGNWGNILTGDSAAAPRYIEARLTKFALEVLFNPKTTDWQSSYDGRNKEPITLPVKFPLLLNSGAEGIAVGLACKILPHNFVELIDGSINILKGKKVKIYPDFPSGGLADFSEYNDGLRGGKIKVRARIHADDKKYLRISEVPYGTTTSSLIDSILKANDRGKIKIKKVEDNTAEQVEILVHLAPNVSPDQTIDALYAFTDCGVSISPNSCVIHDDKPHFLGVSQMLENSTNRTRNQLKKELELKKSELEEQWHFASLEKIFIENRIYRDIEECETWEEIIETIHKGLKPHVKHLLREVTDDDVARLTEIRIKRISKFDSFKADEHIKKLDDEIAQVKHDLDNLTDFAIAYFKNLKKKYAEGRERRTEIRSFETIARTMVAANNVKLYVDRAEGFVGHGLKRTESEFVSEASDIDDVIVFRGDGKMMVTKMADKTFVGKDIIHVSTWQKDDPRTTYNLIYQDGPGGYVMVKRFNVTSIIRDREYDLTKGTAKSKVLHFSANPNGEAELVSVTLRAKPKLKKLKFEFDFADQDIKGRGAKGNILSKHTVNRIELKEKGASTLGARKVWFDPSVKRINYEGRGNLLGSFEGADKILTINASGHYRLTGIDLTTRFDEDMTMIERWNREKPISAIYYDPEKESHYVKRFLVEDSEKPVLFISEHEGVELSFVSTAWIPQVQIKFDQRSGSHEDEILNLEEFIAVKGLKAQGNKLSRHKVKSIVGLEPLPHPNDELEEKEAEAEDSVDENSEPEKEVTQVPVAQEKVETVPEKALEVPKPEPEPEAKPKPEPKKAESKAEEPKKPEPAKPAPEVKKAPEAKAEPKPKVEKKEEVKAAKPKPPEKEEPKPEEKKSNDDDQDSFGAGSQITLEL